ncbi:hypothetical protein ILYODFUR_028225 [Ilyodon furcidens]|uniref:Secreted protein n=1 Tax=Ilyodon furcidens TaxID=33524 RepID=A0ABV0UC54_9TELE
MCHVLLRVPVLGARSVDRRDPNVTPQSVGGSAARPVAVVRPWKDETFPWHHLFGMPRRSSGIHSLLKREETVHYKQLTGTLFLVHSTKTTVIMNRAKEQ